jgi:hypothetical protein
MSDKTIINDLMTLKDWYENLPAKNQTAKRDEIIGNCGISTKTFYNWKNGYQTPPVLAQKEICRIAGNKIQFTNNAELVADNISLVK